jgi:hypothetical protein
MWRLAGYKLGHMAGHMGMLYCDVMVFALLPYTGG